MPPKKKKSSPCKISVLCSLPMMAARARARAVPVGERKILVLNRLYRIEWGCVKFRDLVHPLSLCLLLVRAQSDGSFGAEGDVI